MFSNVFFSFTKWKAVIRNINTNLNELLAKSVLYKAGWILLDSVSLVPLFIPASSPRGAARKSDAAAIPVQPRKMMENAQRIAKARKVQRETRETCRSLRLFNRDDPQKLAYLAGDFETP